MPIPVQRIIAVIGTTGAGKTRLAIQLAQALHGEIINGDATQAYAGLGAATAKPTLAEAGAIPHHGFSFLHPLEDFTVRHYRAWALEAMADIQARGKVPILVGGTMYYVQALLRDDATLGDNATSGTERTAYTCADGRELLLGGQLPQPADVRLAWDELQRVDPAMAYKLHASDWRKISRALEYFARSGQRMSDAYAAQARAAATTGPEREVLLLQVQAEPGVLSDRLSARVDDMAAHGLASEAIALGKALADEPPGAALDVPAFEAAYDSARCSPAQGHPTAAPCSAYVQASELTLRAYASALPAAERGQRPSAARPVMGLCTAIGYKELHAWHDAVLRGATGAEQAAAWQAATGAVVLATQQYARAQLKFIASRFIRKGVHVHVLDSSNVAAWSTAVAEPALSLAAQFLDRGEGHALEAGITSDWQALQDWQRQRCSVCGMDLVGEAEVAGHFSSRRHRRALAQQSRTARGYIRWYEQLTASGCTPADAEARIQAVPTYSGWTLEAAQAEASRSRSLDDGEPSTDR